MNGDLSDILNWCYISFHFVICLDVYIISDHMDPLIDVRETMENV